MTVLGYFEVPEDEQPPEEMWGNDEALIAWFEEIKRQRANPDSRGMEPIPDMQENELTKQFRLGG